MAATTPFPKAQPYTFDLGNMLCTDPNPLPPLDSSTKETHLATTAQQCAQALINQLLTTCEISKSADGALQVGLPAPSTVLPREKPVPKEKEKTKWAKFAEKKGIRAKRKDGKMAFDESKGEWVAKYGYKGRKGDGVSEDWLVEVDEKAEGRAKDEKGEKGEKRKGANGDVERRDRKIRTRKGK